MLEELTFTGRELLLAVVLATAVYLLEVVVFSRRRKSARHPATDARLAELQRQIDALRERLDAMEARPPADSALDVHKMVHAEAMRLAREGASARELAEQLGISRSEADLIIALHKINS